MNQIRKLKKIKSTIIHKLFNSRINKNKPQKISRIYWKEIKIKVINTKIVMLG